MRGIKAFVAATWIAVVAAVLATGWVAFDGVRDRSPDVGENVVLVCLVTTASTTLLCIAVLWVLCIIDGNEVSRRNAELQYRRNY